MLTQQSSSDSCYIESDSETEKEGQGVKGKESPDEGWICIDGSFGLAKGR